MAKDIPGTATAKEEGARGERPASQVAHNEHRWQFAIILRVKQTMHPDTICISICTRYPLLLLLLLLYHHHQGPLTLFIFAILCAFSSAAFWPLLLYHYSIPCRRVPHFRWWCKVELFNYFIVLHLPHTRPGRQAVSQSDTCSRRRLMKSRDLSQALFRSE